MILEKDNAILRYYGIGAQIIKDLRVKNMASNDNFKILTNTNCH